jgi:hypothetical protein
LRVLRNKPLRAAVAVVAVVFALPDALDRLERWRGWFSRAVVYLGQINPVQALLLVIGTVLLASLVPWSRLFHSPSRTHREWLDQIAKDDLLGKGVVLRTLTEGFQRIGDVSPSMEFRGNVFNGSVWPVRPLELSGRVMCAGQRLQGVHEMVLDHPDLFTTHGSAFEFTLRIWLSPPEIEHIQSRVSEDRAIVFNFQEVTLVAMLDPKGYARQIRVRLGAERTFLAGRLRPPHDV